MGCGCNKNKNKTYTVVFSDGKEQTYSSAAAANAAVRRSNGTAKIK